MERLTRTTWLYLGGYALLLLALLAYTLWQRSRAGAGWLFALITLAPVIPFFSAAKTAVGQSHHNPDGDYSPVLSCASDSSVAASSCLIRQTARAARPSATRPANKPPSRNIRV